MKLTFEMLTAICVLSMASAQSTQSDDVSKNCAQNNDELIESLTRNVVEHSTRTRDVTDLLATIRRDVSDMKDRQQSVGCDPTRSPAAVSDCACCDDVRDVLTSLRNDVSAMRAAGGSGGGGSMTSCFPVRNDTANECIIDMVSWGLQDGLFKGGHIRANWKPIQTIDARGIYLAIIDPVTCVGTPFPVVNPSVGGIAQANILISYINLLVPGQILVAATGEEPRNNLQTAFPALTAIGVNLQSLQTNGKFSFVAQKGSPNKTVSAVRDAVAGNLWLVVKLLGNSVDGVTFKKLNP